MNRRQLTILAAVVLTSISLIVSVVGFATAHETIVSVRCGEGIQVVGHFFTGNPPDTEPIHSPVTITGPEGYSESFEVTTAEWAHTFPLGPNGQYHIDWPEAGQFAQDFTVDCAEPTPTPTVRPTPSTHGLPTPTPHRTVPPTDT